MNEIRRKSKIHRREEKKRSIWNKRRKKKRFKKTRKKDLENEKIPDRNQELKWSVEIGTNLKKRDDKNANEKKGKQGH